jgi:glycolate oxidase FAD binding subunit
LPSRTAAFCQVAAELLADAEILAHAGNGIVLGRIQDPESAADVLNRLRRETKNVGGRLVLIRCPPDLKARLNVWGDSHEAWSLMTEIKAKLDPADLFNPGRFVVRPQDSSPTPR